jgi:osmotically-inducible protein OsmY
MKTYHKLFILTAVFTGIVTMTGCNKTQDSSASVGSESSMGSEIKDSEVTVKVKTALLADENTKAFDIAVVTTKGDVRLTGVVDSQNQIDQVDKLVRSIEGVHSIHDELTIKK